MYYIIGCFKDNRKSLFDKFTKPHGIPKDCQFVNVTGHFLVVDPESTREDTTPATIKDIVKIAKSISNCRVMFTCDNTVTLYPNFDCKNVSFNEITVVYSKSFQVFDNNLFEPQPFYTRGKRMFYLIKSSTVITFDTLESLSSYLQICLQL